MLTTNELAQRYPVTNADSLDCWKRLLDRWRTSNKLKAEKHWRIRRQGGRACRPPREYDALQVLRLVWSSENTFAESVKIEHGEEIRRVLNESREVVGI